MHILIPFPYYRESAGGIANFIARFSEEAVKQGHRITIVSLRAEQEAAEQKGNPHIVRLEAKPIKLLRRLREYRAFGKLVQKNKSRWETPDVILGISNAAIAGVGGPLVYRSASGPIAWEYEMWKQLWRDWTPVPFWKRVLIRVDFWLQQRLERECVRAAKALLCQSDAIAKGFQNAYGLSMPIHVPATGVDLRAFKPKNKMLARKRLGITHPLLVYTGVMCAPKGAPILERALQKVFRVHPTVKVAVLGSEPWKLSVPGYEDRILHCGQVSHEQVAEYCAAADGFVFPSVANEGFPNAVLEAMAAGCAIVTTALTGINEYLKHEKSALIVPKFDADALASALLRVLNDTELQRRLRKEAQRASKRLEIGAVVKSIVSFVASLR